MKFFATIPLLFAFLRVATAAAAGPAEALSAFDGLCIGTSADLKTIEKMAAAAGAKLVPTDVMNQDAAVARNGGKGFVFKRGSLKFVVSETEGGACSVLFSEVPAPAIKKLVEQYYPLAKPQVETSGPQTNTLYRIIQPSVHSGGYIMLTVPKPGFGADNVVSVGFIPRDTAAKLRMGRQ